MSFPRRGELYWLNFDPSTGAEMKALHPCVVIQNDVGNKHSNLTIVAAITSNLRVARLPVVVAVPAGTGGLSRESVVHCGHIYTIDKTRLGDLIGQMPPELMANIDLALTQSLGLPTF